MNKRQFLLLGLIALSGFKFISADGIYRDELAALKAREDMKALFDEDVHQGMIGIQRDIRNYKELSFFRRLLRIPLVIMSDVIIITPDSMPKLYDYIETLCKKASIATPTVFVSRKEGILNAFAYKALTSVGGILIQQKLLLELSDEGVEAIVAHEIGHIKNNHWNKDFALKIISFLCCAPLTNRLIKIDPYVLPVAPGICLATNSDILAYYFSIDSAIRYWIPIGLAALIINKRFEKEADEFACKAGKSNGLIEGFEYFQKEEQKREDRFFTASMTTYDFLMQNKSQLSYFDRLYLTSRYYLVKAGHSFTNMYKDLYHNTFWGDHPSYQARIDAAKNYLAQQELQQREA